MNVLRVRIDSRVVKIKFHSQKKEEIISVSNFLKIIS